MPTDLSNIPDERQLPNYYAFLDEIEAEDQELEQEAQHLTDEILEEETAINTAGLTIENQNGAGPDNSTEQKSEGINWREAKAKREVRIREINRMAFDQKLVPLDKKIPNAVFKRLIELLTERQSILLTKYKLFITKRVTNALKRQLPWQVRWIWKRYPYCMKPSGGFIYSANWRGRIIQIWLTPEIPAYFKQNTERQVLEENYPKVIEFLDDVLIRYDKLRTELAKREVNTAMTLIRQNIRTFFDLLKSKPFLFELIFNELTNNGTKEYKA